MTGCGASRSNSSSSHDRFFISYTGVDRAWAEWIAWQLQEAGYTIVLQAWDFRPSTNFVQAMHEAASEAERTIAVLSPDWKQSDWTERELLYAEAIGRPRFLVLGHADAPVDPDRREAHHRLHSRFRTRRR